MFYVRKRGSQDVIVASVFYNTQVIATVNAFVDPNDPTNVIVEVEDGIGASMGAWEDLLEDKINAS